MLRRLLRELELTSWDGGLAMLWRLLSELELTSWDGGPVCMHYEKGQCT